MSEAAPLAFEHVHPATRIIVGPGTARTVGALVAELGAERPFIVCSRTVSRGPQLTAVTESLGGRVAAVFADVGRHGDITTLSAGAELARSAGADVLISIGGGAVIDSAKVVALLLARERELSEYRVPHDPEGLALWRAPVPATLPHIAIPTTAGSSSEIMPWAGVRLPDEGQKMLFCDQNLIPRTAVLDPEIAAPTGPELTATSGATALARAMESLYSARRQPVTDAYALEALRLLVHGLPRAIADGFDLDARAATLVGSLISGIAAQNAMVSVVHAVGHAVGGRYALQHGIAHAILLPLVAARCLPVIGERRRDLLAALDGPGTVVTAEEAGELAVQRLARLIEGLPIPGRLRDAGVARDDVPVLANLVMSEPMLRDAPFPFGECDVLELLLEAW
ncbi:MAG: iron-containing alcohol dehydrogenase family protein [Gaiellaceae bacterium]